MKYIAILFIPLVAGLYLWRAYAHIYHTIGEKNLPGPAVYQTVVSPSDSTVKKKILYVALGDSLTAGVGATRPEKTYPYQLAKLLADAQQAQVTVVNLAVPGAVAADVLRSQVPQVATLHPDIITVAVGVNDMHNHMAGKMYTDTMSVIINTLASATTHLNIINIPFIGDRSTFLPPYRLYFDWQTKRYNSFLDTALAGPQVQRIDLYSLTQAAAFNGLNYYAVDGFHPSDSGYDLWSTIIYDHLNF